MGLRPAKRHREKWADKYGIDIQFVQVNDYIESVNQYTAGGFDGCTMTNMDALTIPATGGVDSTALIVGDYSNGNDGILLKGADSVSALKGKPINLVELSVSHYLLARALEKAGMSEKDVRVVNTADADLVAAFGTADVNAIVTWNPLLAEAEKQPDSHLVFSSAQIPGEILDLLVVNTATLNKYPQLGKALTGAGTRRCTAWPDRATVPKRRARRWRKHPVPIWPVLISSLPRHTCSAMPKPRWILSTARS